MRFRTGETFLIFALDLEPATAQSPVVKKIIKVLAIIFLSCVLLFAGCVYLLAPRPPKEATLIQNFNGHRIAFEQLRDMLQADTNLSRVASWGVQTRKPLFLGYPSEENFPTNRFHQYLSLLKQVNGYVGVRDEGDHADVGVIVWAWGFAGDTGHIWIYWMNETNQIQTMGGYKHIDQNWYLTAD
jgi:hypothetical protein